MTLETVPVWKLYLLALIAGVNRWRRCKGYWWDRDVDPWTPGNSLIDRLKQMEHGEPQ